MLTLKQSWQLLTHLGPGWVAFRAGYALRRRLGSLQRATPALAWGDVSTAILRLHSRAGITVAAEWGNDCIQEAEAVLRGEFKLFSHHVVQAGSPPDWHANQMPEVGRQTTDKWPQKGAEVAERYTLPSGTQVSGLFPHLPPGHPIQSASGHSSAVPSAPPGSVKSQPSQKHWSEISDFAAGDIKGVWELSRFPWAFALARAYARTKDGRFADGFWRLFGDWLENNPPNLGPNWMCGQEATFRLMAVVFAAEVLGVPDAKREDLARFVVATGRRIAANLDYAISQKNNHGVSECIGLITVALLLPDHRNSASWLARGLSKLQAQCSELIYEDGGFSQHSLIYHRVLLHDLCWCRRQLELAGQGIPAWLQAAGERALGFLMAITDPASGLASLYGSNDGANVLPLADGNFLDMRPVIQMTAATFRGELPLPAGSWDEAAAWMTPDWQALRRIPWPVVPARWHAPVAGCFQLAHGNDRLFMRCPTRFRHRPAQADMLHVEVWHEGRPVAMDGGSFSYNSTERFATLGAANQHNVLTVDELEPLRKFSRFLYLPWPKGWTEDGEMMTEDGGRAVVACSQPGAGPQFSPGETEARRAEVGGLFRASHDGYSRLGVNWTRKVSVRPCGGFVILDRVTGGQGHRLTWHWRLVDAPWEMNGQENRIETASYRMSWAGLAKARCTLLRADEATAWGWWSPYYGAVAPAVSLMIETEATSDVELVTEFSPRSQANDDLPECRSLDQQPATRNR